MAIFRLRIFTFVPFLILFKMIESIDMTPCHISSCLFVGVVFTRSNKKHSAQLQRLTRGMQYKSLVMRKPAFCISENKDVDQLRGNREADQRLCFRYIASTILPLPKYKISSP